MLACWLSFFAFCGFCRRRSSRLRFPPSIPGRKRWKRFAVVTPLATANISLGLLPQIHDWTTLPASSGRWFRKDLDQLVFWFRFVDLWQLLMLKSDRNPDIKRLIPGAACCVACGFSARAHGRRDGRVARVVALRAFHSRLAELCGEDDVAHRYHRYPQHDGPDAWHGYTRWTRPRAPCEDRQSCRAPVLAIASWHLWAQSQDEWDRGKASSSLQIGD